MKSKSVYLVGLFVLFSSMLYTGVNPVVGKSSESVGATQNGVVMLWNSSMMAYDVAVSKDGNYIAAVNNTGIYYFASTNSTPKWWHSPSNTFISVAISADGECVVAGDNNGRIHYFNYSTAITGERLSSAWNSTYMFGSVERGTLDISDDGEYVAIGGTGPNMYYYANCSARTGSNQNATWTDFIPREVLAVHISPDGKYVAAGGTTYSFGGFVAFYKDANSTPYPTEPNWYAASSINSSIRDLAVSDDGYAVVAIDNAYSLRYWANATSLSGDPNATWTADGYFFSLDISSDGDEVIGGMGLPMPCGLHFWTGARVRSGSNQTEDWIRFEGSIVWDVAISNDGGIIAASVENASSYKALFFESDGTMIGEFDLLESSPFVSMSGDGSLVAVAGLGFDSLYVFVPEFSSFLILPLFMITTLLAVIVYRRKHSI
ncbi:MAG: hypothetical protein OEW62_04370 [Candidatus Bathyarchaeota archaeon]|nr:hypothetical protein [Candidatus Bathyarchaeota archaeon]